VVTDLAAAGLPAPSRVRFKLFTLDHCLVRGVVGRLSSDDIMPVRRVLAWLMCD
jgi:mRNA interferase MazF